MLVLLILLGCDAAERAELSAARGEAALRLTAPEPEWAPDAALVFPLVELQRLSVALLDDILARAPGVSATLPGGIPAVSLDPRLHVEGLSMEAHPSRPDRLLAHGDLAGSMGASVGGRSVGVPVRVALGLSLRLDVENGSVLVRLDEVESVEVQALGWRSGKARKGKGVEDFLRDAVRRDPPAAFITRTGAEGLPVIAARLHVEGALVRIELRTDVPHPPGSPAPLARPTPERGVALVMRDDTLSALVRREVMRVNDGKLTPFIDPLALDIGDERFSGRVRLRNPGWPAWWQDFTVSGPITFDDAGLRVRLADVQPGAGSGWLGSGRVLADPARNALGEVLGGRLGGSVPDVVGKEVNAVELGAHLRSIRDVPDGFVIEADLVLGAPPGG